jgi:hydrogenase/urease accessory protein HupE
MFKINYIIIFIGLVSSVFFNMGVAIAHTANISSSRVVPEPNAHYRVDVGFLGSDIERMLTENKQALSGVDLTEPGLLESYIGKFIQGRISMHNEEDVACASAVVAVGEDPASPGDSRVVIRFDCSNIQGKIFYNPLKLMEAQGARAKHLVGVGEKDAGNNLTEAQRAGREPAPGQVMIFPGDRPIDLSEPLLGPWELAPKFFFAGMEHIITGYDHLCFLLAVVLWATRIWPIVKIVTAFTISHSVTLTLAALELVNLPGNWVEIAIAASIIYVALENFYTRKVDGRWKDTFAFGFIHGFGFATGLIELGVPQRAVAPALASFNIGVEVGQIGVVLIVMPLLLSIDNYVTHGARSAKLVYALSGVIALFGAYWMLARLGIIAG